MKKWLVEFRRNDEEIFSWKLFVRVVQINGSKEHEQVMNELRKLEEIADDVVFDYIDEDSIEATIYFDYADFDLIMDKMKELGYKWGED